MAASHPEPLLWVYSLLFSTPVPSTMRQGFSRTQERISLDVSKGSLFEKQRLLPEEGVTLYFSSPKIDTDFSHLCPQAHMQQDTEGARPVSVCDGSARWQLYLSC